MRKTTLAVLLALGATASSRFTSEVPDVTPNDNRVPAGRVTGSVLHVRIEARLGAWRPDLAVDSTVTVQTFAEEGKSPSIPGPLIRAREGMDVVITLRNTLDSTLVVRGLRAGPFDSDTLTLAAGETREVRFRAAAPGTYMYFGTTTRSTRTDRPWRDSQLTGVIVVDARGAAVDTAERIFVITVLDIYKGDTVRNLKNEDIWELAINGRSWPHTEQLRYPVGRRVRWRWVNGSYRSHPMHLHGFHFRVMARGADNRSGEIAPERQPLAVTELVGPGSSFAMEWTPTRAGAWLMHCHMIPHITPFPERTDSASAHDLHDVRSHPLLSMAGLVLGITTFENRKRPPTVAPAGEQVPLRLYAQRARQDSGRRNAPHGFVLQRGAAPASDSVEVPGSVLLLRRGEPAVITVVNRLARPTTVHWHGMELESVFDGVAGWSRTSGSVAPLLAPGDSFTVRFTPPRAGTYIYHTHMDEGAQLPSGMYGPMLVLEPGQRYDPARDLVFVVGGGVVNDTLVPVLNGRRDAPPVSLAVGRTYRLRFINIDFVEIAAVTLTSGSDTLTWRAIAKDGADLPPALAQTVAATLRMGVGETYDFELVPAKPGSLDLSVRIHGVELRRRLIAR